MNRTGLVLAALFAVLGVCSVLLAVNRPGGTPSGTPLLVHVAAGLQEPITHIAAGFEQETGIPVRLNAGGSGALLPQIKLHGGDVYIPADADYLLPLAPEIKGQETITLFRPVVVVAAGNPKGIRSLDDLARPGVRLSMADPSAAIGNFIRRHLKLRGRWTALAPNIVVTKPTVNNVIEDVALGAADATIAWDTIAALNPAVQPLPDLLPDNPVRKVVAARLSNTSAAKRFQAYLVSETARTVLFGHRFHLPP